MANNRGRKSECFSETDDPVFSEFASYFINLISNKLSRGSSRVYLNLFDIGIIEWRTLSYLGGRPRSTAMQISTALGLDKAAISRAARTLEEKGLLCVEPLDRRRMGLKQTSKGVALYRKILPLAIARQKLLLSGLTREENELLLSLLKKVKGQLDSLSEHDASLLPNSKTQ